MYAYKFMEKALGLTNENKKQKVEEELGPNIHYLFQAKNTIYKYIQKNELGSNGPTFL